MGSTKLKLLLAGFFVTGGLGLGVGSGWINTVGAQQSGGPAATKKTQIEDALHQQKMTLQLVEQELAAAIERRTAVKQSIEATEKLAAEKAQQLKVIVDTEKLPLGKPVKLEYTVALDSKDSPKWQYDLVPSKPVSKQDFINFVNTKEKEGWEFVGSNNFVEGSKEQVPSWVFRKSTKPTNVTLDVKSVTGEAVIVSPLSRTGEGGGPAQTLTFTDLNKSKGGGDKQPSVTMTGDGKGTFVVEADKKRYELDRKTAAEQTTDSQVKELKAQIEKLQAQLSKVENAPKTEVLRYLPKSVSAELFSDTLDFLTQQGTKKFPNEFKLTNQRETASLLVEGSPAAVKWAKEMLDKLIGQQLLLPPLPKLPAIGK